MDPVEFDRLVARSRDPRLIPGVYNYCDGRCPRCAFTHRCLTYLDAQELKASGSGEQPLADTIGASLQRTLEMLSEVARREGLDMESATEEAAAAADQDFERHRQDPLAVRASEYGHLAWRISRALAPIVALREDAPLTDAVETIEWFSSMISSKLYRAICGQAEGWEGRDEAQTDFNGSAKIALIAIAESRAAWSVLMEAGRATADGVPAQAVRTLDELDASVRERFPRVMEFIRPGFDEPAATGARR
jgi:hypothetical protein